MKNFIILVFLLISISAVASSDDWRDYTTGKFIINSSKAGYGYNDQPYSQRFPDGVLVSLVTVGTNSEGQFGQHIVCRRSTNNGLTWDYSTDIESDTNLGTNGLQIPASWVMPYLSTNNNRLYAVYLWGDPPDTNLFPIVGGNFETHGYFAMKYSDDEGITWSSNRTVFVMTNAWVDTTNVVSGAGQIFWSVCKPLTIGTNVEWSFTKIYTLNPGDSVQWPQMFIFQAHGMEQGLLPSDITFDILPSPLWGVQPTWSGAPYICEEHNFVLTTNDYLWMAYRTGDGFGGMMESFDDGMTWTNNQQIAAGLQGRHLRQPRANLRPFNLGNGHYLLWTHFNGGADTGAEYRNPCFVLPGWENSTNITWGAPELLLYDSTWSHGLSYPDCYKSFGNYYVTETDKTYSRVHQIPNDWLNKILIPPDELPLTTNDLVFSNSVSSGNLGTISAFDNDSTGFTIELKLAVTNLTTDTLILSNLSGNVGFIFTAHTNGAISAYFQDGSSSVSWLTNTIGSFQQGATNFLTWTLDNSAQLLMTSVDGQVVDTTDDGGATTNYVYRQPFGWGHVSSIGTISSVATVNPNFSVLNGTIQCRMFDRPLLNCEIASDYLKLK